MVDNFDMSVTVQFSFKTLRGPCFTEGRSWVFFLMLPSMPPSHSQIQNEPGHESPIEFRMKIVFTLIIRRTRQANRTTKTSLFTHVSTLLDPTMSHSKQPSRTRVSKMGFFLDVPEILNLLEKKDLKKGR